MNDKIMVKRDIVIIGGGPAGLAAALAAKKEGAESILILERDKELGGILNQCVHNGFGLHTFQEELTGPEYAARFIRMVKERQIEYRLNTMVMDISQDKVITAMSRQEGMYQIQAKAVILAMGCRERPRGALNIPGYRPAGIYSAGTAQRLVNMEGFMPGKKVVILGSGDIGLIMARRMTLEGAKVKVVAELMPYSGGLKRNIVQILAMMLFFPILRKFLGTIQVFYTSFVMAILGYAVLLILMFVNMSNLYLLFVPAFFIFSANGMLSVLTTVFLANTVDYGEWKNHRRDESVIFSMQTFVVKLASGVAALIASICLQICNLSNDTTDTAAVATAAASSVVGLRMTMTILPIICLLCGIFIFHKKYILTEEKVAEIAEQVKKGAY